LSFIDGRTLCKVGDHVGDVLAGELEPIHARWFGLAGLLLDDPRDGFCRT
jgi:hypothetical protein